jgi:hypothetical protein
MSPSHFYWETIMHLLVDVEWDDEGQGLEECCLPTNVVVLDVPDDVDPREMEDTVSELLSDAFGFCHKGFSYCLLTDKNTHAGGGFFPDRLGLCRYPVTTPPVL